MTQERLWPADILRAGQKAAALIAHHFNHRAEDFALVARQHFANDEEMIAGAMMLASFVVGILADISDENPADTAQGLASTLEQLVDRSYKD